MKASPGFDLVTTFGLGHLRPASGTWGSLPPALIAAAMALLHLGPAQAPWLYYPVMTALCLVFGAACVVFTDEAEARFGRDPKEVVADETAGQAIALLAVPLVASPLAAVAWIGAAFLLFRAFDIAKPWPANALQRIPGAWGVLLDDVAAGAYAGITLVAAAALLR